MNQLLITVSIILFPGLISVVICDKLVVHPKWSSFKFILYSFILGVSSYGLLQLIIWFRCFLHPYSFFVGPFTNLEIWSYAIKTQPVIKGWEVIFSTICSIPVAMIASFIVNHKIINKIGKYFNITEKYGDENLFSYYVGAKEIDWVYVRDKQRGLTYQGRVFLSSENDNIQELLLSNVTVYNYEDSQKLYTVPTIYLTRRAGRFIIEAIPEDLMKDNK